LFLRRATADSIAAHKRKRALGEPARVDEIS
jgi:hypothetical protein